MEKDPLKHHHFSIERLVALDWGPSRSLDIAYTPDNGSRIDRITPDKWAQLNGYHEATFPIGADEVGYVLIPDTALKLLRSFGGSD